MAAFSFLPEDVFLLIVEHLDFKDLVNISSVRHNLRRLLAPKIFRGLRLPNDKAQANFVKTIAERFGDHVRYLAFVVHVDGPRLSSCRLADAACEVLRGSLLPNLSSIRIRTDVEIPQITTHSSREVPSEIDCQRYRLRAMLLDWEEENEQMTVLPNADIVTKLWVAVTANRNIQKLQLEQLLPVATSVFREENFSDLLARLEKIQISMPAMENTPSRLAFFRDMGRNFFQHLNRVEELEVSFPDELDFEALLHADEAWKEERMLRLKSLVIRKMFLGENLCDLILARSHVLETLHLDGCVCSPCNNIHSYPSVFAGFWSTWAGVLCDIRESDPVLRELKITPRNAFDPETVTPWIGLDGNQVRFSSLHGTADEYAGDIPQKLDDDPNLHIFGYFHVLENQDDQVISDLHLLSMEEFRRGNDQKQFELLMEVVNRNAVQHELRRL